MNLKTLAMVVLIGVLLVIGFLVYQSVTSDPQTPATPQTTPQTSPHPWKTPRCPHCPRDCCPECKKCPEDCPCRHRPHKLLDEGI